MEDKKKVKEVPAQEKLQKFLEKENIVLSPQPVFKPRDDNTFSLVVTLGVEYGGQRTTS